MQRDTLHSIVRFLFKILSRVEVVGLVNVPPNGGVIVAANHMSRVDPVLIFAVVDRDDITALVADKYLRNPFIRWLVEIVHGIWLHREDADFRALRVARDFLQRGGALGIAPEGTRSQVGKLIPAKTGVAYLASKSGVPVVPAAISGTEKTIYEWLHLRRPYFKIQFGEPFYLPELDRRDRSGSLQRNTDEIMCRIAAMLPPKYWGTYAGHPRLEELLVEQEESPAA